MVMVTIDKSANDEIKRGYTDTLFIHFSFILNEMVLILYIWNYNCCIFQLEYSVQN